MIENDLKENYINKFRACEKISKKYELSNEEFANKIEEIKEFKVTTPIIGGFSTGKSSMINALLGERLLKTDIIPETAIPTEIIYGDTSIEMYKNNQLIRKMNIEEFKDNLEDIERIDLIKIKLDNNELEEIKNVKIVDMPGFDSGIDKHNKAIDNYLPQSLAYIITFSADESVIKESIANFLSELKLHDVPVYVVITKCDKVTENNLNKTIEYMKENIAKYIDVDEKNIFCVKSKRDRDVSAFKNILLDIEGKAQELFKRKYNMELKASIMPLEKYINSRLKNINLSDSELEEKQHQIEEKLKNNMNKLENEKEKFNSQVSNSIENIQRRVDSSLKASSSTLQKMILNNSDIQEKVNLIVRNAITIGIKSDFEPKFQKYIKKIVELIDVSVDLDTSVNLDSFTVATDNMVRDIVVKSIPVILATIGGIMAGPLGAIIGGALAIFVDTLFKNKQENQKRQLAREKVENEIIPMIVEKAGSCIKEKILSYVDEINDTIAEKIQIEKEAIEKALMDIKEKRKEEEENIQNEIASLNDDLNEIRRITDGI